MAEKKPTAAQPAEWVTVEVDKDFIKLSLGDAPGGFNEKFIRAAGQDRTIEKVAIRLIDLVDPDNLHLELILNVNLYRIESIITSYYEWNFVQKNKDGAWLTEEYCDDFKSAYERCLELQERRIRP